MRESFMADKHFLLICTVGGSKEPIVCSLKHWKPDRIIFVPSPETEAKIRSDIIPLAQKEGINISDYEIKNVPNAQDLRACLEAAHDMQTFVLDWNKRGEDYQVVLDITGGTKLMTIAFSLVAHTWPCVFSYVGGEQRGENGCGVVVSGKEKILHWVNPWDVLGYQTVEDAVALFDRGSCGAAADHLQKTMRRVTDPTAKRELASFHALAEAYASWDRFDHNKAANRFWDAMMGLNDLRHLFPHLPDLHYKLKRHHEYVMILSEAKGRATLEMVFDLIANAERRACENRFDDAVARLYRAVEALAQIRLADEKYGIPDTSKVPIEKIPKELHGQVDPDNDGNCKLSLQISYKILEALGDPLGLKFFEIEISKQLTGRNSSILAHGFNPISNGCYIALRNKVLELASIDEEALPKFPKLGKE